MPSLTTKLSLKKKNFESNNDSGEGLIVFDTSQHRLYVAGETFCDDCENVTYSQLTTKISGNSLVEGRHYRITDYVTTTAKPNTQSAGHAFDLIVKATSPNKIDCRAMAIQHSTQQSVDFYFTNNDLSKWQIWYDVNNDSEKYDWADSSTGKGVIYRMIDEFGNDCPYDFKNIQFTRKVSNGAYDPKGTATYVYTFAKYVSKQGFVDASISTVDYIYSNIIKPECVTARNGVIQRLNDNVFFGTGCCENIISDGCYSNTFGESFKRNKLGEHCSENVFGTYCSGNVFGSGCTYNVIENYFVNSIFENGCSYIKFENENSGSYIKNLIIEGNNSFLNIYRNNANSSNYLQNILIAQGFYQSISTYKNINNIERNLPYRTTVAKRSDGTDRIYNEDDSAEDIEIIDLRR